MFSVLLVFVLINLHFIDSTAKGLLVMRLQTGGKLLQEQFLLGNR
jgi:hypothetical protein